MSWLSRGGRDGASAARARSGQYLMPEHPTMRLVIVVSSMPVYWLPNAKDAWLADAATAIRFARRKEDGHASSYFQGNRPYLRRHAERCGRKPAAAIWTLGRVQDSGNDQR